MDTTYKIIGGDGREYGPVTLEEIRDWISDGRIGSDTLVWRGDEQRWQRANGWEELRWDLPQPAPSVEPPPPLPQFRPAGFWVRALAYLMDSLLLSLIMAFAFQPWMEEVRRLSQELLSTPIQDLAGDMSRFWALYRSVFVYVTAYTVVSLAYFVGCNGRFGCTPGKWVMGLRILNLDGSPLGFRRAFWRYSAEVLSFLTFGIGYLMIAFSPEKRGLHDILAGTRVVHWRSMQMQDAS